MEKTKETMSSPNILDFCRLCLVKENVSVLIFEEGEDSRQIFRKISACLPVKVSRDDELPKKICDDCVCRLDSTYEFCNLSANSEKQLLQWLADSNSDHRKEQISLNTLETEQFTLKEEALDEQLIEVPKASSHVDSGVSDEIEQRSDEEDESEMDVEDDGTNSIDESEDTAEKDSEEEDFRVEPTTFVNVSMHDGDAGPSGIQKTDSEQPTEETLATLGPSTSKQSPAASGYEPEIISETLPKECQRKLPSSCDVSSFQLLLPSGNVQSVLKKGNFCSPRQSSTLSYCSNGIGCENNCILKKSMHEKLNHCKFKCEICEKLFSTNGKLQRHVKCHSNIRPYNCELCLKRFKHNYQLNAHKKIHSDNKSYICEACGYATVNKANFASHQKRHLKEFKFKCNICSKGFYSNFDFKAHQNFHDGTKPHLCDMCGKAFLYKQDLKKHMLCNHPTKDIKLFICEICTKSFPFKYLLDVHVNSHTKSNLFICDVCGKCLLSKKSLRTHMFTHSGEKPYVCGECGKPFGRQEYLKVHEQTHRGLKPHACDTCGKCFTQRSTLMIHMRYHTGQRPYTCSICMKGFVSKTLLVSHQKKHN